MDYVFQGIVNEDKMKGSLIREIIAVIAIIGLLAATATNMLPSSETLPLIVGLFGLLSAAFGHNVTINSINGGNNGRKD